MASAQRSAVPKSSPKARLARKNSKGSRAQTARKICSLELEVPPHAFKLWRASSGPCSFTCHWLERLGPSHHNNFNLTHTHTRTHVERQSPAMAAPINTWILLKCGALSEGWISPGSPAQIKGILKKDTHTRISRRLYLGSA